jgi:DinB superfamily
VSVLIEQFDLVWALAQLHLDALVEEDFLWEPAGLIWTVHPGDDGLWRPDFAEQEPNPIPVPTIAWLTWHIDWWWSTALAHATGEVAPDRAQVFWPGTGAAAVARIRELADAWRPVLSRLADTERAPTAAWLNVELMKNVAEIGQLRLIRAAG